MPETKLSNQHRAYAKRRSPDHAGDEIVVSAPRLQEEKSPVHAGDKIVEPALGLQAEKSLVHAGDDIVDPALHLQGEKSLGQSSSVQARKARAFETIKSASPEMIRVINLVNSCTNLEDIDYLMYGYAFGAMCLERAFLSWKTATASKPLPIQREKYRRFRKPKNRAKRE